jgi:carbon storage regulator
VANDSPVVFLNVFKEDKMLVLSRGKSQVITIGDDIRITVVEIRNGHVKIGVDAPRDLQVLRAELTEGRSDDER